ncbi:MAG: hypothetical protein ABL970_12855 [Nitrospira sp.]
MNESKNTTTSVSPAIINVQLSSEPLSSEKQAAFLRELEIIKAKRTARLQSAQAAHSS